MHAVALGQELQVKKVVIPAAASVFSAWGMMMSDLRRDFFVTRLADLADGSGDVIEAVFADTERQAMAAFVAEGIDENGRPIYVEENRPGNPLDAADGKKGETIKAVSQASRAEIAEFLGRPVHLFLQVKVRPNWLEDAERYDQMGLNFKDGNA